MNDGFGAGKEGSIILSQLGAGTNRVLIRRMLNRPLTRADVETELATVGTEILGLGVRRLALCGSVPRNEARFDSDVDVLVEFVPGQKSFDRLLAIGDLLEARLARRHILVEATYLETAIAG